MSCAGTGCEPERGLTGSDQLEWLSRQRERRLLAQWVVGKVLERLRRRVDEDPTPFRVNEVTVREELGLIQEQAADVTGAPGRRIPRPKASERADSLLSLAYAIPRDRSRRPLRTLWTADLERLRAMRRVHL